MRIEWLERLLADRGVSGPIVAAALGFHDGAVYLHVTTLSEVDGEAVFFYDIPKQAWVAAEERHVIAVGGMILD